MDVDAFIIDLLIKPKIDKGSSDERRISNYQNLGKLNTTTFFLVTVLFF